MRPEKLVMENFGSFRGRAELDFSELEDIFLISGKTGAGKTTIFDAICFALYGKVPGSRGDHPARLRSDHAPEGGECSVSLEFSLGEKRYLVERSPRQDRKKKRGEGTIQVEETLVLYEIMGDERTRPDLRPAGSKKSEAGAKLKELIGLEAEEFFKIVLLPQGEFAEFLKQNTSERQKVLGKLFPVEKAVLVKDLARKKAADMEAQVKGAAHILEDIRQKVNPETYEKARSDAVAALEGAEEKCLSLESEEDLLGQVLGLRRNEKDAERRLSESRKLLEETLVAGTSVNEKITALSRSRSARPLEQYLRGLETANLAAVAAEAALAAAALEKDAAGKAATETERANRAIPALEKDARDLREKRPAFAEMLDEEEKLKIAEENLQQQEALKEKLNDEIKLLSEELDKQEISINETEVLASEQSGLEEELELSRTIKDLFLEFRKYRELMDDLERERSLAEQEVTELESRSGEYGKHIPVLEAELKGLREEKSRYEQANMAAHLSAFLEEGKPCPVCGSTEHPRPASCVDSPFDFGERIKVQEVSLREAEKNRTVVSENLEAKKREVLKTRETLSLLGKNVYETRQRFPDNYEALSYPESPISLPSKETIDRIIKNEAEKLNEILNRQKISRNAGSRINELFRQKAETQNKKGEADRLLVASEEQQKSLTLRITESRERYRSLLTSAAFPDNAFSSIADTLAALDKAIAEKESLIARHREEREKTLLRLSGAEATWERAFRSHNDSIVRLKEEKTALNDAVSTTGFSNPGEAGEALLDLDVEEALEKEIRLWRENRAGLDTQIAEKEKQLDSIRQELSGLIPSELVSPKLVSADNAPLLEEATQRLEALRLERTTAEDEKNRAFLVLANLEKDREALLKAQKRYDTLAAEAGKFRALSDDLSGKNPLKLPFDSWLLGNYLEEAAAYATKRLERMSESRYSLLLDTERQQSRGYAGLDLMVFDAYTGRTRPCATLSGGESFMASISLALGLADSIQNRSGGVRLDAVFIDEGFGSLDETSLDKALVILDELRDSRMVGLISHVGELRSRIPCQVEVIKTGAGSRVEARQRRTI